MANFRVIFQSFLIVLCAVSSCRAWTGCTGTNGTKTCVLTAATGVLNCNFTFPLSSLSSGAQAITVMVKGFPSSNITVASATVTTRLQSCAAGFSMAGPPTFMSDSCFGLNNIASFTTASADPTNVEMNVVAVFNNVGNTSSDAVGVWVNNKLIISWATTTSVAPLSDVCSLMNLTMNNTCSDSTLGFFEPVVCSIQIPVAITQAKTTYDVQIKLPNVTGQDIRIERAKLSYTIQNNCSSLGLPSYEIKTIYSATTYSSSAYWYDTADLTLNFYGDMTASAKVVYLLTVNYYISQIQSFTLPNVPVMTVTWTSNDGVSASSLITVPNTTIAPTSAYFSCNNRALYYLDWTTCKSVFIANAAGTFRLLLNTTIDIQIEDVQVPLSYCTDCGAGYPTLPTVTITNLVNSRTTGYVDVVWTMGGLSQLLVVVDITISAIVLQYPAGGNGTVTVDRVIAGSNMTTETLNLTLVGSPMVRRQSSLSLSILYQLPVHDGTVIATNDFWITYDI